MGWVVMLRHRIVGNGMAEAVNLALDTEPVIASNRLANYYPIMRIAYIFRYARSKDELRDFETGVGLREVGQFPSGCRINMYCEATDSICLCLYGRKVLMNFCPFSRE